MSQLVVLIGASGSGKTAIAAAIDQRFGHQIRVFYFDRMGVPPAARMIAEWGSMEAWQRAKTLDWIAKLAPICALDQPVLFEGQTKLRFLAEAVQAAGITTCSPLLLDCDDATRAQRLHEERQQPELANPDMMNWADYLRRDARKRGCEILDTSQIPLDPCVDFVMTRLTRT